MRNIVHARSCHGKLDYKFEGSSHNPGLMYEVPLDCSPWHLKILTSERLLNTLEMVVQVIKEAEELAGILVELSNDRYKCRCGANGEGVWRRGILMSIFQIQLCVARLFNVRIEIKNDSQDVDHCALSQEKAARIMEAQVGVRCVECLQRIWKVLQALETNYIAIRRHRLRPQHGSLMDLLFGYPGNDIFWSLNPASLVRRELFVRHYVSERPSIRCKMTHDTFALLQSDTEHFDAFLGPKPEGRFECAKQYLEHFRPLLGFRHGDETPVWKGLGQSRYTGDDPRCRCSNYEPVARNQSTLDEVLTRLGNYKNDDIAVLRAKFWKLLRIPDGFVSMYVLDRAIGWYLVNSTNTVHKGTEA